MIILPVSPVRSVAVKLIGIPPLSRPLKVVAAILASTVGVRVSSLESARAVADREAEGDGVADGAVAGVVAGVVVGVLAGVLAGVEVAGAIIVKVDGEVNGVLLWLKVLNPKNASKSRIRERATFVDFWASSAAFL